MSPGQLLAKDVGAEGVHLSFIHSFIPMFRVSAPSESQTIIVLLKESHAL